MLARFSTLGALQSQQASHTIERGGGSMSLAERCSSRASSQPISDLLGWQPSTALTPGYRWRLASSRRYTVLMAHMASSRRLVRSRMAGSHLTAIGSRIGCTSCSRAAEALVVALLA